MTHSMDGWFGPAFRAAVVTGGLSITITGAGSWLGQAFLAMLVTEDLLPPAPRLRLFGSASRSLQLGGRTVPVEQLAAAEPLAGGPWLLLHFAFLGQERAAGMKTGDFVAVNADILRETLRLAEPAQGLRVIFSSSGAVYGPGRRLIEDPETSPYGWCKMTQERYLAAWCRARGVPLAMPRIFNLGGDWINKTETYALSSFISSAQRNGVIRILARRPVFRSFVHVAELHALLCEAVLTQIAGSPLQFDTAGLEIVEMADLADAVTAALRLDNVTIERAGPPMEGDVDYYVGDGRLYRSILAQHGRRIVGLARIVTDTAAFLARTI